MKTIYLDNNATTKLDPKVLESMLPYLTEKYYNPSSQYSVSQIVKSDIEEARTNMADLFRINASELVFTASGTESANFAIRGVADALKHKGNHIITSKIEHPCVLNTCKYLEKNGFDVTYLPVDNTGRVKIDELEKAIKKETILVSIMYANSEIGTIQPIKEIGEITKKNNVVFFVDGVQAVGKVKVFPKELNIDLLSFSSHKFYGPKGIGGLYIRNGLKISSIITGGHQERNRRAATENVAGIIGSTIALEIAYNNMEHETKHKKELATYLEEKILKTIPECFSNGNKQYRIPGTISITFKYVEGESILISLDMYGICVSSGSACSAADLSASPVILAIGVPIEDAQGTIRFGIGRFNTRDEMDKVMEVLPGVIDKLREMSPLYNKR